MKKLFSIQVLGSLASIIALGFFIYFQFIVTKVPTLEILTISDEVLTQIPNENKLKVNFNYNEEPVENLSKIRFIVKNIGTKTIIGKDDRDLLGNILRLRYNDENNINKIYNIQIVQNNFPIELKKDSIGFFFKFKQWRKNEFIEIVAYVGNNQKIFSEKTRGFTIDERDIIDGNIKESIYQSGKIKANPKIIDSLSPSLKNTLWWNAVIGYLIMVLVSIPTIFKSANGEEFKSKSAKIFLYLVWLILLLIFISPILWMIEI